MCSSTLAPSTQLPTSLSTPLPKLALNACTLNACPQRLPQTIAPQSLEVAMRRSNVTPIVEALNVEALNVTPNVTPNATPNGNATPIVEALNVEALNYRALDVYTLFLFKFIKNFASQVALGGSKFAYLCGHITRQFLNNCATRGPFIVLLSSLTFIVNFHCLSLIG